MPDILELLANADEGVYAVDSEQKIILWNKRAQEILGYASPEVIGRYCYDLIAGKDADGKVVCGRNCAVIEAAKLSGRTPSHYCVMRNKAGDPIWLHITHVVVPSRNRELEAVVHIFRDITELMDARDLLQQLQSYLNKSAYSSNTTPTRPADKSPESLTSREREVLSLLAQGGSASSIAQELMMSTSTARNHIQNILSKLGVHSALEAVAYAHKNGLL